MKYLPKHDNECKYAVLPTLSAASICKQCCFNFWTDQINQNIAVARYSKARSTCTIHKLQYERHCYAIKINRESRRNLEYYDCKEILVALKDSEPHTITKGSLYVTPYKITSEGFLRVRNDANVQILAPRHYFTTLSEVES
jgi:hypothetical protein